jgi:cation/acetate symporter
MVGTAGLPHVIIRFYTVKSVAAARSSALWAILFIGILYTTAPAIATFARVNMIQTLHEKPYEDAPGWYKNWEKTGLIAWVDKNNDGLIQYAPGDAFAKAPEYQENADGEWILGAS